MSADNVSRTNADPLPVPVIFGEVEKNWGWLLLFGILSIVLGTLGLGMTFVLTEVSVIFFGALLVVGGVFQLLHAIKCRGWKSIAWHVLIALLYVAAGLVMLLQTQLAALSLTLVIAYVLIAIGVLRVIMAFQMRPASGWWWPLVAGIVSAALGAMILAQWPQSGLWIIGLFIAIELIFNGWSYIFIALAARAMAKRRGQGGVAA
jgi:uncharacterized membrane protein HdeD (DUF308 family)